MLSGVIPVLAAEDVYKERLKVCENCQHFTNITRQCMQCGCFMDVKAKILKSECPIGLW